MPCEGLPLPLTKRELIVRWFLHIHKYKHRYIYMCFRRNPRTYRRRRKIVNYNTNTNVKKKTFADGNFERATLLCHMCSMDMGRKRKFREAKNRALSILRCSCEILIYIYIALRCVTFQGQGMLRFIGR